MTLTEVSKLIQGIFDNIFNSVTQAEPGGKPVAQASSTVLTLMKPGLAINSADFRNPWTPGNSSGSQDAAILQAAANRGGSGAPQMTIALPIVTRARAPDVRVPGSPWHWPEKKYLVPMVAGAAVLGLGAYLIFRKRK